MSATVIQFPTKLREPVVQPEVKLPDWARISSKSLTLHKLIRGERVFENNRHRVRIETACGRHGWLLPGANDYRATHGVAICRSCSSTNWPPRDFDETLLPTAS